MGLTGLSPPSGAGIPRDSYADKMKRYAATLDSASTAPRKQFHIFSCSDPSVTVHLEALL